MEEFKMKRHVLILIAIMLFFCLENMAYAENEVQLKGTVTKLNGNQITIKDDKGGEITIESSAGSIKVGDIILIKGEIIKVGAFRTALNAQDVYFLTKQCQVDSVDVNVIPQLEKQTMMKLISWVDKRDCKLMEPFKASRAYFRQLKPKSKLPLPPAGWDTNYLTDKEFEQYTDIIANAPW